ncbi:LRRCT domain-containing protein [Aphelenchoides fujianensis]|nr:LRRCT domain-containing protein [Aphelenchoides fujianensis]
MRTFVLLASSPSPSAFAVGDAQPWLSADFPIANHDLRSTRTVTCASANLRLKTVVLPPWAETFHAHNVSVPEFPHFAYHPGLKILRINACDLQHLHPLSFIPLPNLETIQLADNAIEALTDGLFRRLTHLRVLSLSNNRIRNLDALKWSLPAGHVLEQLHLDKNPIALGVSADSTVEWPAAQQLFLEHTNIQLLNSTHLVFKDSAVCPHLACRVLRLNDRFWSALRVLDLSENPEMVVDRTAIARFGNITNLRLANCRLSAPLLKWIDDASALRHLDLAGGRLDEEVGERRVDSLLLSSLEWLDISRIQGGLTSLHIPARCSSLQWLYAESNRLEAARLDSLSLRGVHLSDNRLNAWPLQSGVEAPVYAHLEYLDVSENALDSLPERALHVMPQMEVLDLSLNRLTTVARHALPTLELRLHTLNLSANYIEELHLPVLPSLVVLDISSNNLVLQRLRLSHNPQAMKVNWESMGASTQLAELDLEGLHLAALPPLQEFKHLRTLDLRHNQIVHLDGARLPPCPLSLNVHDNLVHDLGNFSETQFSCLKELDLSDRTQYYCFADSWQHPLQSYVQSAEFCRERVAGDRKRVMPFSYKPVAQSEIPVDL